MLQVGNAGLSLDESRSHFSAWAVVAAPLLIAADVVSGLSAENLAILTAPEIIAVSQDILGVQGVRVSARNASGSECWARPLADGSVAALLLNRALDAADAACTWEELGLKDPAAPAKVRDLWARADLGTFSGAFIAKGLAGHASMLVKVAQ
jgi:alpha-galactosidase